MSITWDVKVTGVNPVTKRANVEVTRTDSELADGEHTYTMTETPFETPEQRAWAVEGFKGWIEQEAARITAAKVFVGTFEQDTKVALEIWETTRIP